jgi:hypothetical protein
LHRLANVIPDHSPVGAYSNSLEALLYKQTAHHLPSVVLMSAFGGPEIADTMRHFMSYLEMAERAISKEQRVVLDSVHPKDKGPLLYWLTYERDHMQNGSDVGAPARARLRAIRRLECVMHFGPHSIEGIK